MVAVIVRSEVGTTRIGAPVRIAQLLSACMSALAAEYRARQAAKALYGLNDHMLADIGLSRADIETAVRKGRAAVTGAHDIWCGR
ncbi:MAG TPA: DUF1127 domain-containing protein [Beijerinckiaceae bacterium]|jgi:uncharacterized protein YjiS (DUF1127 family)